MVDRLLALPTLRGALAQHWLDVIRWAETVGFETNLARPNAWHYRDWVIRSLNEDKPYNQFVFEQLAGDTVEEDAALGFLVAGPANLPGQIGRDEAAMREARQDELDEVIRTVGQSLFGLTIGCGRCHDHKFDPITQRDYYSMQAIFAGLTYGDRRLRGPQNDEWTAQVPAARDRVRTLTEQREQLRIQHNLRPPLTNVQEERFDPVTAVALRMQIESTAAALRHRCMSLRSTTFPIQMVNLETSHWLPQERALRRQDSLLRTRPAISKTSSMERSTSVRHFLG